MNCPVTCGVCKGVCKDVHDDCPGWAKEGECVSNPGHTLKTCPTSCGLATCKAEGGCADKNATACAIWALEDECIKNPAMMMADCAATCGVCTVACEDKAKDCPTWATEGQCEANPEGMLTTCPQVSESKQTICMHSSAMSCRAFFSLTLHALCSVCIACCVHTVVRPLPRAREVLPRRD